MKSQTDKIAALLMRGKTITQPQANKPGFNCGRLAARIGEMRKDGWLIETIRHRTQTGAIIGKYKLIQPA